jgi:hypothetical protein
LSAACVMLKSFSLPHENTKRLKLKHTFLKKHSFFHATILTHMFIKFLKMENTVFLKKAKLKTANFKTSVKIMCRYVIQRHNVTVFYAKVI